MRFNFFAGLFALSGALMAYGTPAPSPAKLTVGDAISLVNGLQSSIIKYEQQINNTVAGLGSTPSAAQKAAAAIQVNLALQAITTSITKTAVTVNAGVSIGSGLTGTITDLVAAIASLVCTLLYTLDHVLSALDGVLTSVVHALLSALAGLISALLATISGLLTALGPVLTSLISTIVGLLGGLTGSLSGLISLLNGLTITITL